MVRLFQGAIKHKGYVFVSILLGLIFWAAQFLYQYYIFSEGQMGSALIRSAAFTGATLIGIALIIGPFAKLFPSMNYIKHRRTFGVLGFTFIIMHYITVMYYFFGFDVSMILVEKNPFINPVIFGSIAFLVYLPIYLTSNDWSNEKLKYYKWKFIHRLVYLAWIISVLHFLQVNPMLLLSPVGYLLLGVTALVFMLELAAFVKYSQTSRGMNTVVGILLIIIGLSLFYFTYQNARASLTTKLILVYGFPIVIVGSIIFYFISSFAERKSQNIPDSNQNNLKEE